MTTINDVSDSELVGWIGNVFLQHLNRIEQSQRTGNLFSKIKRSLSPHKVQRLKNSEYLSKISTTAADLIRRSVQDGKHHYRWVGDPTLQIFISTFRSSNLNLGPSFESGYTSFIEQQWDHNTYLTEKNADFAHVIFDTDMTLIKVHLNYLPRDGSEQILPLDILSEEEKQKFGVFKDGDYCKNRGRFNTISGQREKTEKSQSDTTTEVTVVKTDGSVITSEMPTDNAKRMADAYTHAYKGINLEKERKWYEAIKEHKKSIALSLEDDPNRAIYFTNLGVCYAQTGKIDVALEQLETAVRLDPSYKRARENLDAVRDLK